MGPKHRTMSMAVALAALHGTAGANAQRGLAQLSLEELGNLEVTSVSRRAERLADAPASVFVITADDIRRSGAVTLPEALRMAPNLHVARSSASNWAISTRGFNGASANKLLVLIDGRSVYSPIHSGVFWDAQIVPLADVERIEVVSGPGGTLWGVNAVNGVINVITRSAADTTGTRVHAGWGNQEGAFSLRHGFALGDSHVRLHAQHHRHRRTQAEDGSDRIDATHTTEAGFRADGGRGDNEWMLQGSGYTGKREQPVVTGGPVEPAFVSGGHVLGRWEHKLGEDSDVSVQAYIDHTERELPPSFAEKLDVADVLFQHRFKPGAAHSLVWGAKLRQGHERITNGALFAFLPAKVNQRWSALFVQDEIALGPRVRATLGARVERNSYTGSEFLPSARLAWKWAPNQLLWTALSRTVRAPSRLDRDLFFPPSPPFMLAGGPNFRAETAHVAELGYRGQLTPRGSLSATVFHARYDHLRSISALPGGAFVLANEVRGTVAGLQAWGAWQVMPRWRVQAGLTRLFQDLETVPGSTDTTSVASTEGANPRLRWLLRSSHELPRGLELDLALRHVAALSNPAVPRYTAFDVWLGWRSDAWQVSISGRNLLGTGHAEFGSAAARSEFGPSVLVELAGSF